MGRVRFELTMFLVWRFYRPLASAILHTYPKYVSILYCNSDNQLPLLLHLLFFFYIFNMLDFFLNRTKNPKYFLKYFSNSFSANRFPDQPHQIFVVPSRTRIFGYFCMSDFSIVLLPSWPHIHFAFSSIPRPVIHFFSVFCHHMFHLIFVLMYTACTEIWTLDLEIKSFLLYQTKLYRRFPGFILQCAWRDSNTRYTG